MGRVEEGFRKEMTFDLSLEAWRKEAMPGAPFTKMRKTIANLWSNK